HFIAQRIRSNQSTIAINNCSSICFQYGFSCMFRFRKCRHCSSLCLSRLLNINHSSKQKKKEPSVKKKHQKGFPLKSKFLFHCPDTTFTLLSFGFKPSSFAFFQIRSYVDLSFTRIDSSAFCLDISAMSFPIVCTSLLVPLICAC